MKKSILIAAAAVAVVGMSACSGKHGCGDKSCNNPLDKDQVYTGVLPAADSDAGIRYTLRLDYDDDHNYTEGDYDLVETVLVNDSIAGVKDGVSYTSEGDFKVVERDGKKYLTLVKDAKDSNANASGNLNFVVDSDSTLTMVNADFQPAATDSLNYTLKLAK